jgi:hypothetical protein
MLQLTGIFVSVAGLQSRDITIKLRDVITHGTSTGDALALGAGYGSGSGSMQQQKTPFDLQEKN